MCCTYRFLNPIGIVRLETVTDGEKKFPGHSESLFKDPAWVHRMCSKVVGVEASVPFLTFTINVNTVLDITRWLREVYMNERVQLLLFNVLFKPFS